MHYCILIENNCFKNNFCSYWQNLLWVAGLKHIKDFEFSFENLEIKQTTLNTSTTPFKNACYYLIWVLNFSNDYDEMATFYDKIAKVKDKIAVRV